MRYIPGVDLLRFAGAMSVVALHSGGLQFFESAGLGRYYVLVDGNTGVILFYVISGYLITSITLTEIDATGRFSVGTFIWRRVLRIFPLYFLVPFLYLAFTVTGLHSTNPVSLAYAFLYSYNFIPIRWYDGWLGSLHTLATEEHFYLLFPDLMLLHLRLQVRVWLPMAVLIVLSIALAIQWRDLSDDYFVGRWSFIAWRPILIGCLFGIVSVRRTGVERSWILYLAIFAATYGLQCVVQSKDVVAIGFGFLLLGLSSIQSDRMQSYLNSPATRYLGIISYGIYLWQSFVLSTGSRGLVESRVLSVILILALSILSWELLERPIAKVRRQLSARATRAA